MGIFGANVPCPVTNGHWQSADGTCVHVTNNGSKFCTRESGHYTSAKKPANTSTKGRNNTATVVVCDCYMHRQILVRSIFCQLDERIYMQGLRLSSTPRLIIPRTRTELAKRAFSVAAPALWNSLPADVVDANSLLSFNKHLKPHLYQRAYYT